MRQHLVRINDTMMNQAPFTFNSILISEIVICFIYIFISPLFCIAACRVGSIHRNFRCQVCLTSLMYAIGICARFVLIYYQISGIPFTDDDPLLLAADLLRDLVMGYYCGMYERNSCSTFLVILISESINMALGFSNGALWLSGYGPFLVHFSYLLLALTCSVLYLALSIVPCAIIASPCFVCFFYNVLGPEDWLMSRSIAYAVWDLIF
ncbi:hypothetical protein PENTCL1PPCAC_13119, partial [Pristionchus entomophagus]